MKPHTLLRYQIHVRIDKLNAIIFRFQFGKGATPGIDLVIVANMTDTIDVNGLGFSASNNMNVSWELLDYAGKCLSWIFM